MSVFNSCDELLKGSVVELVWANSTEKPPTDSFRQLKHICISPVLSAEHRRPRQIPLEMGIARYFRHEFLNPQLLLRVGHSRAETSTHFWKQWRRSHEKSVDKPVCLDRISSPVNPYMYIVQYCDSEVREFQRLKSSHGSRDRADKGHEIRSHEALKWGLALGDRVKRRYRCVMSAVKITVLKFKSSVPPDNLVAQF